MWYHLRVDLKKWRKWTYLQNKNRLKDIEHQGKVTKGGKGGEGIN